MEKHERQNELISLLPEHIQNADELKRSLKITLGALYYLNGLDKVKENGYIYRSNQLLQEDTQLSQPTIISSMIKLIELGFIKRTVGDRKKGASIYNINFKIINQYQPTESITKKTMGKITDNFSNRNFTNNGLKTNTKTLIDVIFTLSNKIDDLTLRINELSELVKGKENMGKILGKNIDFTTDPDTDIDQDINNNIINNNTNISNTNIDNNGPVDKKEVSNKKDLIKDSITSTNVDDTNNDNVSFKVNDNLDNIEVCVSAEQREDEQTNDVIEYRNKKENITSIDVEDTLTTDDNSKVNTTSTNVEDDISNTKLVCDSAEQSDDDKTNDNNSKNRDNENLTSTTVEDTLNPTVSNNNCSAPAPTAIEAHTATESYTDIQTTTEAVEVPENARYDANWAYIKNACTRKNKQYFSNEADYIIKLLKSMPISQKKREKVVERYFEGMTHKLPCYLEVMKKEMMQKIATAK